MSEPDWKDHLEDVVDLVRVLKGEGMKVITEKVVKAYTYTKIAAPAVLTVPLVAGSIVPTISNIPVRKPDENIPAQSQATDAISEGSAFFVSVASGDSLSREFGIYRRLSRK